MTGRMALLATLALGGAARAEGVGEWFASVTTQDGDAIVEPGESAFVTLGMDFTPDLDWDDGPALAYSTVIWDTLGGEGADRGSIAGWTIPVELVSLTGDLTTTDRVSLFGSSIGQLCLFGVCVPDDPLNPILTFEWQPDEYTPLTVEYSTLTHKLLVLEGEPFDFDHVEWEPVETTVTFQVVPGPGGWLVTTFASGLAGVAVRPRRRRAD